MADPITVLCAAAGASAASIALWRWRRRQEAKAFRHAMSELHPTEPGPEAELLAELRDLYADHDVATRKNPSQLREEAAIWRKYGHEGFARTIDGMREEALREEIRTAACMKCHAPHGTPGPCKVSGVYSGNLHQWAGVYPPNEAPMPTCTCERAKLGGHPRTSTHGRECPVWAWQRRNDEPEEDEPQARRWTGVLTTEGVPTGDHRQRPVLVLELHQGMDPDKLQASHEGGLRAWLTNHGVPLPEGSRVLVMHAGTSWAAANLHHLVPEGVWTGTDLDRFAREQMTAPTAEGPG